MPSLAALIPLLDLAVAGVVCAWILSFASEEATERATRWMCLRAERVRLGALLVAAGMFLDLAAVVLYSFAVPWQEIVAFAAYPFWLAGISGLASATWPVPDASGHAQEVRA